MASASTSGVARWFLLPLIGTVAALALVAPVGAQVTTLRPITPELAVPQIDYRAEYEKLRARNQELRAENAALRAQLDEWSRKGGSLVHAYCDTPTLSRSSAGASNDCAASGYACEPVSGLCRTSANSSSDCAGTWIYCATTRQCVAPSPGACR